MRGSFSQNRDGLNYRGTEKVLFIDYFLKDHEIDLKIDSNLRDVAS